jgi:hypothetical protein
MNGADPRGEGGKPLAAAQVFQAAISVTNSVIITARTQKDNRWSSPLMLKFVSQPPAAPPKSG